MSENNKNDVESDDMTTGTPLDREICLMGFSCLCDLAFRMLWGRCQKWEEESNDENISKRKKEWKKQKEEN